MGGRGLGTHAQGPLTCQPSVSAEGEILIQDAHCIPGWTWAGHWSGLSDCGGRLPLPGSVSTSVPQLCHGPLATWMPWMSGRHGRIRVRQREESEREARGHRPGKEQRGEKAQLYLPSHPTVGTEPSRGAVTYEPAPPKSGQNLGPHL